jgi:hypothetical protein
MSFAVRRFLNIALFLLSKVPVGLSVTMALLLLNPKNQIE